MAGIYKVIVGEKALFEINKKLNGSEKIRFNGAFAHTRKFNIELIYVQDGVDGRFFDAYILTMEQNSLFVNENANKRNDLYFNYSILREKVYENFRTKRYHHLFEHGQ